MVLPAKCAGLRAPGRSLYGTPAGAPSASGRQSAATTRPTAQLRAAPGPSTQNDSSSRAALSAQRPSRPTWRRLRCTCSATGAGQSTESPGCKAPAASHRSFSPNRDAASCVSKKTRTTTDKMAEETNGTRSRKGVVATALRGGMIPGEDSEESTSKAPLSATEPSASAEPVKRRRGRPAGIPAWNKNKPMSEASKRKLSKTVQDKWKDKEFREQQKLVFTTKGTTAWNKGKTMSAETRQKMSEARMGKRHSKSVRRKLSMAHSRRALPGHTIETQELLSRKLRGKPKSPEHKAAIAASMRRRHAAARVLAAVEEVHRELSAGDDAGTVGARRSMSLSYESAAKASGTTKQPTRSQVLNSYKAQLREYRNLQEELSPWTDAFIKKKGKKPSLADVENTQIDWLIVKYKQYILLRDRLLRDIPTFKDKVGAQGAARSGSEHSRNSTEGDPRKTDAVAKMKEAMDYKQRQGAAAVSALPQHADSAPTAAAEADGRGHPGPKKLPALGANTNERAASAVEAALEYRRQQAKKIAAKARAAATAASREKA